MEKSYSNNLQLTRFIAAALVIVSHSFPITQGTIEKEWLYALTNGQLTLGALAVAVFFLCGGYLSAGSVPKYTSMKHYTIARLKRLLPSLWFVVISCMLLGVFVTTLTPGEYFTNTMTYRYLLNGIMLLQHDLPGVFENAVYLPTVNGSLWTLPIELVCNILCYCGLKFRFVPQRDKQRILMVILVLGSIFLLFLGKGHGFIRTVLRPCLLFGIGMFYRIHADKIILKKLYAWMAFVGLIICAIAGLLDLGMLIFFPYIMIVVWFGGGGAMFNRYRYYREIFLSNIPMGLPGTERYNVVQRVQSLSLFKCNICSSHKRFTGCAYLSYCGTTVQNYLNGLSVTGRQTYLYKVGADL